MTRSLFVHMMARCFAALSLVACTPQDGAGVVSAGPVSVADQDLIDFRQNMTTNSREAHLLATRAREGENLSELSVGWYVYGVLTELSAVDQVLDEHFGSDVLFYLKHQFRLNAAANVEAIDHLDGDSKRMAAIRRAAHWALESLCHIPTGRETEAMQASQREMLAIALESLAAALDMAAVTDFSASSSS